MIRPLLFLCVVFLSLNGVQANPPENIKLGFYGRTEQNIYRFYAGTAKGNYYTQRTSSGYSAGVAIHSSINYLFNAGVSLGLSEARYSPHMLMAGNNTLWHVNLRLWQFNFWGELKLGTNETRGARVLLGGESMYVDYKREMWSLEKEGSPTWPYNRFMPRVGIGYEFSMKNKWTIAPNAGFRLAFKNAVGYDYTLNQFWVGVNLLYKMKSW